MEKSVGTITGVPVKDLPADCIIVGERIAEIWERLCREKKQDPHTLQGVPIFCVVTLGPSEVYGFGKGAQVVDQMPSQAEIDKRGKRKN